MNLTAVATAVGAAFVLGRLSVRHEVVAARREASTDNLTALPNRAALMRELHNRTRKSQPHVVLLFDLNNFKTVNDTYGHRAGDALLVTIAGRLRTRFPGQLIARLGGDEFVAILDGTHTAEAVRRHAEHLVHEVERAARLSGIPEAVKVSAAVGITAARRHESPSDTLHAADQAMYRSKRTGRPHTQTMRSRTISDDSPNPRLRDTRNAPHVRVA